MSFLWEVDIQRKAKRAYKVWACGSAGKTVSTTLEIKCQSYSNIEARVS